MRLHILVFLLGLVATSLSPAQDSDALLFSQGGNTFIDQFSVPLEHIATLPRWSPTESSDPPLSISAAVAKAILLLQDASKGWPWDITAVSLCEGRSAAAKGVWFYHIYAHINISPTKNEIKPISYSTVVLLDGTVMSPEVSIPEGHKEPAPIEDGTPHKSYNTASEIRLFFQGSGDTEDHYSISKLQADRLPKWTPELGTLLPFEAKEALLVLHKRIQEKIPGQKWRFLQFSIMPAAYPESRHIWRYQINIIHEPVNHKGESRLWNHCILLDGSVLSPDPEKLDENES